MAQVIFRFEKVKNVVGFVGRVQHNERTRPPMNADPDRKVEVLISAGPDPAETLSKKLSGIKRKKDSVLALEAILSASPEFFAFDQSKIEYGKWDYAKVEEFKQAGIEFFKKEFGENIVSLSFHADEATPHFQCIFVPIIGGKLNAKLLLGNRKKMSEWQDKAHAAVEQLGISRGIKGSKAKHSKVSEFYNRINEPVALSSNFLEKVKDHARLEKKNKELVKTLQIKEEEMEKLKKEASVLREIDLGEVLTKVYGAELTDGSKESHQSRKYKVGDMKIVVSAGEKGQVFVVANGWDGKGKGAIDLVKYLSACDYRESLKILSEHFSDSDLKRIVMPRVIEKADELVQKTKQDPLPACKPDESQWKIARQYLTLIRVIPEKIVDSLHSAGKLFADSLGNVVFPRANGGFFKRGRGNFKQTLGKKECGPYVVEGNGDETVLVEGPVDALSYKALFPEAGTVLAIGGNLMEPIDAKPYIKTNKLVLAFDNDEKGKALTLLATDQLKGFDMSRKVPKGKDWNEDLFDKALPAGDEATVPLDKLFTTPQVSSDESFPDDAKSPSGNEELSHDETGFKGPGG